MLLLLGSGAKRFVIILMITLIPTAMSDPHLRGNQVTLVDEVSWKWNDRTDTDHKDDLIDHLPSNVVPPLHHTTDVKTPLTAALRSSPPTEVEARNQRTTMMIMLLNAIRGRTVLIMIMINALLCTTLTVCMQPGSTGGARQPPAWGPDMEHRGENSYSFKTWTRDLLLWTIANGDIEPHRQAAMILGQLKGAAQTLTREIPINIIMNGGVLNGNHVDGPTYILNLLSERYAQLGEEARLRTTTDLM
jgi:hypothetical protein